VESSFEKRSASWASNNEDSKAAHKKPKKHPAKKVEAPKPATPDAMPKGEAPKQ
jgi:hypothetical protein